MQGPVSLDTVVTPLVESGKRTRRTKADMERDWYGCFAKWDRADRSAALKALAVLHEHLPDEPRKAAEE